MQIHHCYFAEEYFPSTVDQVWFRRGVNSHNPCGSGWISMIGEMIMINVGLNDQVTFFHILHTTVVGSNIFSTFCLLVI